MAVLMRPAYSDTERRKLRLQRWARRRKANREGATRGRLRGKAPADRPALKPYWGKPAVRNFRGDDGNVGIMRSPVRAIVLPDRGRTRLRKRWALAPATP